MKRRAIRIMATLALAGGLAGALTGAAQAGGTYYVGTTVASNSVLWAFVPSTNLVKLCYSATAHTLACTPTKTVFNNTPLATDAFQFRISQNSQTGGLWLLDMTSNKQALCEAALNSTYTITCTLGSGLK